MLLPYSIVVSTLWFAVESNRTMKGELEELGESTEGVENISKMQGQIYNMTGGRVNIFDANGDFRSTYDIMKDIAAVYNDLTDTDRASLLETIAGKDRANDVASLLQNMSTAVNMVETAENAAGSARGENEKYLDSLQGRLDVLTSSIQAFSAITLDSGFLKGIVSGATEAIDIFSVLIENVGVFPTLLGAVGAGFSVFGKGISTVDKANGKFKVFGKSLSEISDIITGFRMFGFETGTSMMFANSDKKSPFEDFSSQLEADARAFDEYRKRFQDGVNNEQLTSALAGASNELRQYIQSTEFSSQNFDEFSKKQKEITVATEAQKKSFKSVSGLIDEYNNGCNKVQMTQTDFVQAVNSTNPVMGSYLSNLKGTRASMTGYAASLVVSTAKTVALTVASTALNAILTMGIGAAIGLVVSGIGKLITYYDDLAESVEASSSAFDTANSELMNNRSAFDEAVQSYEKLRKGVNKFTNENVSLSADEYEEYLNVVNTIADSVPSMVAGFDSQGNAILNTAASVDELTKAYNDLIVAESEAYLKGDEEKGYVGLDKIAEDWAHDRSQLSNNSTAEYDIEANKELQRLLSSSNLKDEINKLMKTAGGQEILADISNQFADWEIATREAGESYGQFVYDTILDNATEIRNASDEYGSQLDTIATELNQAAQSFLNTAFYGDLYELDDTTKNAISRVVSNFDGDFYEQLVEDNGGDRSKVGEYLESYMSDLTNSLGKLDASQQKAIADAFDMQIDFSSGEVTMDEFAKKAQEVDKILQDIGLDESAKEEIMLSLGFEYDDDGNLEKWTSDYETALNRVQEETGIDETKLSDWFGGLSGSDLAIVLDMELDGVETIDELQHALDLAKALQGVGLIDIQAETDSLDKLNAALQESNGTTGLTQESIEAVKSRYSDLEGYDAAGIFEKTTTGIRLNEEALESLEDQYVKTNKAAIQDNIDALVDEYARVQELRDNAAKGSEERKQYDADLESLEAEIQDAQMAAAAYDGLTSAYNRWVNAKSAGEEGDMYDSITSETEQMNEYASQGLFGRNDVQSYADMFFGEGETDNWSADDYSAHWQEVVDTQNRYFTEGREGAENFISDIKDEFLQVNDDGDLELKPGVNIEDVAEYLGKSNSLVEAMFGKLNDYGFEFEIGIDGKSVDELVEESNRAAEAAEGELQKYLGKDFEIDGTVNIDEDGTNDAISKLDALEQQREEINNSEASVEVKEQGVDAVNAAIRSVIAQKIEAEQPAYMHLDASDITSEMADALTKAQEMRSAIENLNSLELQAEYGLDVDDDELASAKQKVQDLAAEVANNSDLKVKLGFEEGASAETVLSGFENNTVTINTKADTSQAKSDIDSIGDKTVNVTVNVSDDALSSLESRLNSMSNKEVGVTVYVWNSGSVELLRQAIANIDSKTVNVTVTCTPSTNVTALQTAINSLTSKTVNVTANVNGTSDVNALNTAIGRVSNKSVTVTATTSGTSGVNSLADAISRVQSKTVTISAVYTTSGSHQLNGTAHVEGTVHGKAFKQGSWGAKENGTALMGELGPELIVRGDRWFTVGDNGAGFYQYKKNDIIFNHKQTEELLKNGYITSNGGRGRAFLEGTAFASVSGGGNFAKPWGGGSSGGSSGSSTTVINNNYYGSSSSSSKSSSSKSSSSKSSTKKATEEAEEFEEALDLVEIMIDRVERAIDKLDLTASSTFKTWTSRTSALNSQISKTREEIDLQQKAYQRYIKEAESVGLSSSWAQKVREGKVDIETITDEDLKEKIDEYQEW